MAVIGALALGLKAYLDRMPTPPPAPKPKGGDMFGFGSMTAEQIRKSYIPQGTGTFSDIWKPVKGQGQAMKRGEYEKVIGKGGLTTAERRELKTGGQWDWLKEGERLGEFGDALKTGYVFLPEGFIPQGPSITGVRRPAGLD